MALLSALLMRLIWAGLCAAHSWLLSRLCCQLLSPLLGLDSELSLALLPSQPSGLAAGALTGSSRWLLLKPASQPAGLESGDGRKLSLEQLR